MSETPSSSYNRQRMLDSVCSAEATQDYGVELSVPSIDRAARLSDVPRNTAYRIWESQATFRASVLSELILRYVEPNEAVYAERRRWIGLISRRGDGSESSTTRDTLVVSIGDGEVDYLRAHPVVPRLRTVVDSLAQIEGDHALQTQYEEALARRSDRLIPIYQDLHHATGYTQTQENNYTRMADETLVMAETIATHTGMQEDDTRRYLFLAIANNYTIPS